MSPQIDIRTLLYLLVFATAFGAPVLLQAQFPHTNVARTMPNDNPIMAGNGITFHLIQADNFMKQGLVEQAIMAYDNAVAQNPNFAEAYIKRAIAKYRVGRMSEAQRDYQLAIRINPYIADMYGYGNNLSRLSVLAFEPYELVARLELEEQIEHYQRLTGLLDNELLYGLNPSEQIARLTTLMAQYPQIDSYYAQRALLWLNEGSLGAAQEDLRQKLAYNPNDPLAYGLLSIIHLEQEDWHLAEQALLQALEHNAHQAIYHYQLGYLYKQQQRYRDALIAFDQTIELAPGMVAAYFGRAMVHKAQGDVEASLADYDAILQADRGGEVRVWLNRSVVRKMSGDVLGALADVERAIALEGTPQAAALYKLRGNLHILLGNYLAAEDDYSTAIRLQPDYAEAYYNRGIARVLGYNRPDACDDFQASTRLGYSRGQEQLQYLCSY
jgi:tetratricopeptide (TPR) repeat protein